MFNVLICRGLCRFNGFSREVNEVNGRNLGNFTNTALQMKKNRAGFKAVYLRGEIFVFYGKMDMVILHLLINIHFLLELGNACRMRSQMRAMRIVNALVL